ncbi:hypothetical protein [Lysinibacillus sp. 54212]|uniref:hypothetical protein n=1 Tax=Lysinibacillus sp. 54212 TaxID=3119829 RepID=UPI002FC953B4
MNEKRKREKFNEIMFDCVTTVLVEEADAFRTLLLARGIAFKETKKHEYFIEFERGTFT